MNRILGLIALSTVFLGLQAHADTTFLSCSNGTIDQVGDALFQVNIMEDGIEFLPYEGSYTIDAASIMYDTGTFVVLNETVTLTSEGDQSQTLVNAMLTMESSTTLNVAISLDGGAYQTYVLTCVEN